MMMEYFELATSGFGNFVVVFLLSGMFLTACVVAISLFFRLIAILFRGYRPKSDDDVQLCVDDETDEDDTEKCTCCCKDKK